MNSAVNFISPANIRASLSQRVARIELPPLSSLSQPQMVGRSPYLNAVHLDGGPELIGRVVTAKITAARRNSLSARARSSGPVILKFRSSP